MLCLCCSCWHTLPYAEPVLTKCRCIDQLLAVLENLYLHTLAIPMCHLKHLLARAVLHSPALAAASQLQLAALAETLGMPEAAAAAEKKAGPLQLSAAQKEKWSKVIEALHFPFWLKGCH